MSKKALFIFNPHSGKGLIKNHLLEITDILVKADYEVTVYPTQSRGDAERKMREREKDYALVVCSGGDGTLDEIVTGMIQSGFKTPIGYIPSGSTNDFAKTLKIPSTMKKAAELIARGKVFSCDVGRFNRDVFVYVAAFGLFTEVSYETPQEMKNMLGHVAYFLEGVRQLTNIKSYLIKVTYVSETGEEEVIEDDFIFGMVTNSHSVGGFKSIAGNVFKGKVDLNDGLFEVTLIKVPKNPVELNSILASLAIADIDTQYMYNFKSGKLTFESEEEVAWTLDGEYGGKHTKVELLNDKGAMDILVK
ncbi:MAG: diacylglycerol kinase family lipid kinase [Lachnospiraceae bacterium]|nr:diacylglycerol kinase family lipid kinase [Lachnospiraceae bacterium]